MKDPTLKEIGVLTLIGIGIGLFICLLWGEFEFLTVVVTTAIVLGVGLSGTEVPTTPSSPEMNSLYYKTDLATGKLITELQKLNEGKPESGIYDSAEMNSTLYNTDLGTGKVISELQKLNKNNENKRKY